MTDVTNKIHYQDINTVGVFIILLSQCFGSGRKYEKQNRRNFYLYIVEDH
jgi:hypothetical protein